MANFSFNFFKIRLKTFFIFYLSFIMYNCLALDDKKDVSEEVRMLSALRKWIGVVSNNAYGICKLWGEAPS
jgi:hypothetical protein